MENKIEKCTAVEEMQAGIVPGHTPTLLEPTDEICIFCAGTVPLGFGSVEGIEVRP